MKIAVLSYPMLFQNTGGLQIQVLETVAALNAISINAKIINPNIDRLSDFDIVHVFSVINGNFRIVEQAKAIGKPVVVSTLVGYYWNRSLGIKARILERIVGRITRWDVRTEYRQIESCLTQADHLVALGQRERVSITTAFRIPEHKISIIPNGIATRFFVAEGTAFSASTGIPPGFVLCVAAINRHKNQLALVEATQHLSVPVVLIGPCLPVNNAYLKQLTAYPHVHYLGALAYDDPLLAAAYAAAGVFCLPSISEVMPLCVLEALAAGTPVVVTQNHSMDVSNLSPVMQTVAPLEPRTIRVAIERWLHQGPSAAQCKAAVQDLSWAAVAAAIQNVYKGLGVGD